MTPFDFVLIACTIISTSFISGLFGMAGGMILVGVLLVYFDVATGMVIFSIIQFVANGWRAVLWVRFVIWRIFFVYVAGAVISFAIMRSIAIIPSKAMVYLGLRSERLACGAVGAFRHLAYLLRVCRRCGDLVRDHALYRDHPEQGHGLSRAPI